MKIIFTAVVAFGFMNASANFMVQADAPIACFAFRGGELVGKFALRANYQTAFRDQDWSSNDVDIWCGISQVCLKISKNPLDEISANQVREFCKIPFKAAPYGIYYFQKELGGFVSAGKAEPGEAEEKN